MNEASAAAGPAPRAAMARLAIVDQAFNWPPRGGASVDIQEVASRLAAAGFDVRLFVPAIQRSGRVITYWGDRRQELRVENLGFTVETVPVSLWQYRPGPYVRRLRARLRRFSPDHLIIGDSYFLKPHLALGLAEYRPILRFYTYEVLCHNYNQGLPHRRQPVRCDTHSIDHPYRCAACLWRDVIVYDWKDLFRYEWTTCGAFLPRYHRLFLESLRNARSIIVYNEMTRRLLEPYNRRVKIIPSGVDTEWLQPHSRPADAAPLKILMHGRIDDAAKGGSLLIEACRRLWQRRRDFRLVLTARHGYPEEFIDVTGWLDRDQVMRVLGEVDIVVAPSVWHEALGIAVIEAMACGLPVVASRLGGHSTTVVDGESGLLFEAGNVEQLTALLERLLDDPELRARLGRMARVRAVREFAWPEIIERHYLRGVLAE